jgi:hypothetical protein
VACLGEAPAKAEFVDGRAHGEEARIGEAELDGERRVAEEAQAARTAKLILDEPHVFQAVGLVAQALVSRQTLAGEDVEAIVERLLPGGESR